MEEKNDLTQEEIFLIIQDQNEKCNNSQSNDVITDKQNMQSNVSPINNKLIINASSNDKINKCKTSNKCKNIKRCQYKDCKRKLGLYDNIPCKCGLLTCYKHRIFYEHECTYDYKKDYKQKIKKNNPLLKKQKFEMI